ncbi:MAG: hypothetical protein SWK76_05690 [Actinomycetota bacterium]|nr:hypothetical protein [Actinomycetota bacterium]
MEIVQHLSPVNVAYIVNNNREFAIQVLGELNPLVIAEVINNNGTFITQFAGLLNAYVLARAINENTRLLVDVLGGIDPLVVTTAVNANGPFLINIMGMLGALDSNVLAGAVASKPSFITNPVLNLGDPGHSDRGQALVDALNATGVDTDSNTVPITSFDQFVIFLHSDLNILGLGHHLGGKLEGLAWDPNGGDPWH